MKKLFNKIGSALKTVYGWGILVCLFAGGLSFFGFVAALIIGGDTAAEMCRVIHKVIFPYIIYASTVTVVLGLVAMYLCGEVALSAGSGKKKAKAEKKAE